MLKDEIYVDDVLPEGKATHEECLRLADELTAALAVGGLSLKGCTFSGHLPEPELTSDGKTIMITGMKWSSAPDYLQLNTADKLNYSRKVRGKKSFDPESYKIPNPLTRRHVVGKIAEIWDLCGFITPLVARFKLDLRLLVERGLDWDDEVPLDLMPDWIEDLQLVERIGGMKFRRALVPEDAVSLDIETIEAGDASKQMMVVGRYGG